jgi:hypothetical protein
MKDRYLDLAWTKDIPERRKTKDRRKVDTVLDPSVERRKRARRIQEIKQRQQEIEEKKNQVERKNLLIALAYFLGGSFILAFCITDFVDLLSKYF